MMGTPNYHVIDTDYEKFAFVYNCENTAFGWARTEAFWILTREPVIEDVLKEQLIGKIREALPKYDFDYWFSFTVQGETCEYADL